MLPAARREQRSHESSAFRPPAVVVCIRSSLCRPPSCNRLRLGLRPPLRFTPLGTEDIHDREVDLRFFGQRHGCDDETRFSRGGHTPLTRAFTGPALGAARSRVFNEAVTVVEVRLLGPLEVDVDGRILDVRRQKQRALLALLALRAGEVVPTDRLVDELWGDEPPKAAVGSLQNFVSELRKMLGAEVLVTRSPGYLLDISAGCGRCPPLRAHRPRGRARSAGAAGGEPARSARALAWAGPRGRPARRRDGGRGRPARRIARSRMGGPARG